MKKEISVKKRFVKNPINGRSLNTCFLNNIYDVVQERIPTLPYNTKLTIKKICGADFWDKLFECEKIEAGHCMSYLIATKRVQMINAGYDCHFALTYLRV